MCVLQIRDHIEELTTERASAGSFPILQILYQPVTPCNTLVTPHHALQHFPKFSDISGTNHMWESSHFELPMSLTHEDLEPWEMQIQRHGSVKSQFHGFPTGYLNGLPRKGMTHGQAWGEVECLGP